MTPERFARIDSVFNAALDVPASKRLAFLDSECGGDDELRREVIAMLEVDAAPGATIDDALLAGATAWEMATEEQAIGQRLGPYRITAVIGRGGTGSVYRAVRDDAAFDKEVAIKVLRSGMDSRNVIRRFDQERRILARLEHPNVARLLDAGTATNGLPYIVMEYVEDGVPVTVHCRKAALDLEKRILLFLDICSAVGYAHQSLVVHRDLKPGNILVDKFGTVKLLDFGIARVLSDTGEQTLTLAGAQMLTPEYASPEQVRGELVTTATDVYSLGIVLYEMLTGRKAQTVEDTSIAAIAKAVCETVPERPSLAADLTGPIKPRDLKGDLDNIILKALHKERERRYSSVEQLAEDLRAYLQGLPVRARPDSWSYRASKYIRRNRVSVILAAAVASTLIGGSLLLWMQVQATRRQFDRVRSLSHALLFEFHDSIQNLAGATAARKLLVERGLQYLSELERDAGSDTKLQREIGVAYGRLGDVQGHPTRSNIGDSKGALRSYQTSVNILERAWHAEREPNATRIELLQAYGSLASLQRDMNDTKGALESYRRAIAHGEAYTNAFPGDVHGMRELASAHDYLGRMSSNIGLDEAYRNAQRAVAIWEEITFKGIGEIQDVGELGSSYATLGIILGRMGRVQEALAAYRKSLSMQERLVAMAPDNVMRQRNLMIATSHVADTLGNPSMVNLGKYREAADTYAKVVKKARWLVSVDVDDRKAEMDLAFALLRHGNTLKAAGDPNAALRAMDESFAIFERLRKSDGTNSRMLQNLGFLHYQMADVLGSMKRWSAAAEQMEKGLDIFQNLLKADPRETTTARMLLEAKILQPRLLKELGRDKEALQSAGELERMARQPGFTRSKEPRARACVARALHASALIHGALGGAEGTRRESELLAEAETEWKRMESEGLMNPAFAAEREVLRQRRSLAARP